MKSSVINTDSLILIRFDSFRHYAYGLLVCHLAQAGKPIPTNDIWIAAAALESGARLVSYDAHFAFVPGLLVLAP